MGLVRCLIALTALSILSCQADINVTDYIYWKKEDIKQWNEFFPSRYFEEELSTNNAAREAVNSIITSLRDSLSKIVAFQYRELRTAKEMMAGTNAEGCINGISNFLDKSIQDQLEDYQDCAADALSKLARLNSNLNRQTASYQVIYQRALTGIDACAKTYPNKDSIDRLSSCVESMNSNYFAAANKSQISVFPSPSMSYFQNTVVNCASSAAQGVASKGFQFLKMLVNCASLSETVDPADYAYDLSHWKGYNDTLYDQISKSLKENYNNIFEIEKEMIRYYDLQKQALEKYVIQSRGLYFYFKKVYSYLSDYYNTLTSTSLDNPEEKQCVNDARNALDNAAALGANASLACDQLIVRDTENLLADVYDNFLYINSLIKSTGNVAVLKCISQGYVFAPNTIRDCFLLSSSDFDIVYTERYQNTSRNIETLSKYMYSFFMSSELPCGGTVLRRVLIGADVALYNLQRCLYISSGTTYKVTTPNPIYTTAEVLYV